MRFTPVCVEELQNDLCEFVSGELDRFSHQAAHARRRTRAGLTDPALYFFQGQWPIDLPDHWEFLAKSSQMFDPEF